MCTTYAVAGFFHHCAAHARESIPENNLLSRCRLLLSYQSFVPIVWLHQVGIEAELKIGYVIKWRINAWNGEWLSGTDWQIDEKMLLYTLIGGYMLTSVLLFKYPTLLHKKKRVKFLCQHISHRGGESSSSSFSPLCVYHPHLGSFVVAIWCAYECPLSVSVSLIFAVCDTLLGAGESYENTMCAFRRLVKIYCLLKTFVCF